MSLLSQFSFAAKRVISISILVLAKLKIDFVRIYNFHSSIVEIFHHIFLLRIASDVVEKLVFQMGQRECSWYVGGDRRRRQIFFVRDVRDARYVIHYLTSGEV